MKTRSQNGYTLTEVLIVIIMIAVLALILFPAFNQMRQAEKTEMGNLNIRKLNYATLQYQQDNDEKYPRVGDDCLSHRTSPNLFATGQQNQCGGDGWQDMIGPYLKDTSLYISPDDQSKAGGPPTVTHGSLAAALARGGARPLGTGHATDFKTTDGNLSYLFNALLGHQVQSRNATGGSEGYANPAKRKLIADGLPLAGIRDPTACVMLIEGHGGWDITQVDPNAVVKTDWLGSTDLQNKWHHAYTISNETFFLVPRSYSGLSFIHVGLPLPGEGDNVAFCDGHEAYKPFLTNAGLPNLCHSLPWTKSMDPQQRGREKDSCNDVKNPVGAGWETSNWF